MRGLDLHRLLQDGGGDGGAEEEEQAPAEAARAEGGPDIHPGTRHRHGPSERSVTSAYLSSPVIGNCSISHPLLELLIYIRDCP